MMLSDRFGRITDFNDLNSETFQSDRYLIGSIGFILLQFIRNKFIYCLEYTSILLFR